MVLFIHLDCLTSFCRYQFRVCTLFSLSDCHDTVYITLHNTFQTANTRCSRTVPNSLQGISAPSQKEQASSTYKHNPIQSQSRCSLRRILQIVFSAILWELEQQIIVLSMGVVFVSAGSLIEGLWRTITPQISFLQMLILILVPAFVAWSFLWLHKRE